MVAPDKVEVHVEIRRVLGTHPEPNHVPPRSNHSEALRLPAHQYRTKHQLSVVLLEPKSLAFVA